jgi:hypothetical protein
MATLNNREVLTYTSQVGASQTALQISKVFPISVLDSECITVDFIYSAATAATGITAKLQSCPNYKEGSAANQWIDHDTVAITSASSATLKTIDLNMKISGDQSKLPLRPNARIVITTGSGDSVTFDSIIVSRRTFN